MPIEYHRSDLTTNAGARPIIDHLSDAKVGEIVGSLADAFPRIAGAARAGHAQRQAIGKRFREAP